MDVAVDAASGAHMPSGLAAIQRATIEKLRKDNEHLKEDLYLENKFCVTALDKIAARRLAGMQDEADSLTRIVQLEQRKVAMAQVEQKASTTALSQHMEVIKMAGGINSATDRAVALQKEIRRQESRRQQASIRCSEAQTHCKELRVQIDSLRRERLVFDGIYTKLQKELQEKMREMGGIIDATYRISEQRETCLREMTHLKATADKEQVEFETEWKKLGSIIDQDKRNRELARTREMEQREQRTQELLRNREEALLDSSSTVKPRTGKLRRNRTDELESLDKVQLLGEAFQKIQQSTGIVDIDDLIDRFKAADDQNYTLFTYVNELNQEVAKLEEQVRGIEADMQRMRESNAARAQEQASKQHQLQASLADHRSAADRYRARLAKATEMVEAIHGGVAAMFTKLGCNTDAVSRVLGDPDAAPTEILQQLSVVEQRVSEILRLYYASLQCSGAAAEHLKIPLGQSVVLAEPMRVVIVPPGVGDDEGEDVEVPEVDGDDEPRPLTHAQLLAQVQKRLGRKIAVSMFQVPVHAKGKSRPPPLKGASKVAGV